MAWGDLDYAVIPDEEIRQFLSEGMRSRFIAVDTETDTIELDIRTGENRCLGISIAHPGKAMYFPWGNPDYQVPSWVKESVKKLIESHDGLVFQNAKFDIESLRTVDIWVNVDSFYDTLLMAHHLNENLMSYSLDNLGRHYCGATKANDERFQGLLDYFGWGKMPSWAMRDYAEQDARLTLAVFEAIWPEYQIEFGRFPMWNRKRRFLTTCLMSMERTGILINQPFCTYQSKRGQDIMEGIVEDLGFTPAGNALENFILVELGLPVVKRSVKTNKPSFDKYALQQYDEMMMRMGDSRARMVLTYRGWQKTISSNYRAYLELLSPDGRLRPNFKMHGTETGRMSCSKPNLQQIPRQSEKDWNGRLKEAFIPEPGYQLWEFDYSQLEFRLGAAYGKEKKLLEAFNNGFDPFQAMSEELTLPRQDCKTLNYTIQFGGGPPRISAVFGIPYKKAVELKSQYWETYPGLHKATYAAQQQVLRDGYIRYWSGRRRHFAHPGSEAHAAFNALCQGGAQEIVQDSMQRCVDRGLNDGVDCRMLLQIHDSIVFEIKNESVSAITPEITEAMEDVSPNFGVRFSTEAKQWASRK